MDKNQFEYLISKQSQWAEEYKFQQELKHKERLIKMSKYRSRGNKMTEEIDEQLNNLHRFYSVQPY